MGLNKGEILLSNADRKILSSLGKKIREARLKKKLSVYDITGDDMLIKSRQHWQKIEAGKLGLTFITFIKIAKSLDVQPTDLIKEL